MRVTVTGAGGFIGHHLARYLKRKGYWVRGVDLEYPKFSSLEDFDEFEILDLRQTDQASLAAHGVDRVYALAAQNGSIEFTTTNKADLVHDNILINVNTAEACVKNNVERLFFSSSACVYPLELQGVKGHKRLKEEYAYPADPDSEYGWEKLFSERLYKSYEADHGLKVRIARFFNIYGPECLIDTLRSKAPMALTRKVIEGGEGAVIPVWGKGDAVRSFCYVDDCVRGIDVLMESDVAEPVNLGTDDHISVSQLVRIIAEIEGVNIKQEFQKDKVEGVKNRWCDYSKAKLLLNWDREVKFREGMAIINKFVHEQLGK